MFKPQPYLLKNTVQHYEWGTKGKNAFIPKFLNIIPEKDKPYAELWMGAHPKASSKIFIDGKEFDLEEVIREYPIETLGMKTVKKFSNTLPFLFKVLSVNEALSIQAHPNKRQAKALHKKDPLNYPDDNQKHEIAIALDSLTALVGFKPCDRILKTLRDYPEIGNFIVKSARSKGLTIKVQSREDQKRFVKRFIKILIKKSYLHPKELNFTISNLRHRIRKQKNKTEIETHFLKLHKKYGNDVGVLLLFFLNLVHLKRGEAIFTKPGVLHTYLKGNILECMSNSDNVIRAGLTPKLKDLNTLLKILKFDLGAPQVLKGKNKTNSFVYNTEAKEFVIHLFHSGKKQLEFEAQSGPSILLVLKGELKFSFKDGSEEKSKLFSKGESVFLPSVLSDFKILSEWNTQFVIVSIPA